MKALSRRTLLRGAGAAMALPLLESMVSSSAEAQEKLPRRIVFEFKPNGDETLRRFTKEGLKDFEFGEFLAPLEPYRDDLLILNLLDKRFGNLPSRDRADNHQQGGMALAPWPAGEGDFPIGGENRTVGYVLGPSADYEIGERVLAKNAGLPHRHLVYRVGGRENNIWNLSSHAGPMGTKQPVIPETSPYAAYERLFSDGGGDAAAAEALRLRLLSKQSVLDVVLKENEALVSSLGNADRQKIEQYTSAVRDIERTLVDPRLSPSCKPAALGAKVAVFNDDNHVIIGKAFQQLMTLALSCDLTRSINFNWHGNTSNRVYTNLGLEEGHHDISHKSDADSFAQIRSIHTHLWNQSVAFYEALKAVPEGDGTLWDNTLIVHWNELGQGDVHSTNDILTIFAGGMGNYFKRGEQHNFDNKVGFSEMLVSCFHYMGLEDVEMFGDPRLATGGPIPGITA